MATLNHEIINKDDKVETGYVRIMATKAAAYIGVVRKGARSGKSIAFTDVEKIDEAIKFLKKAKKELTEFYEKNA